MLTLLGAALLAAGAAVGVWVIGQPRRKPLKIVARITAGVLASGAALFTLCFLFLGAMCGRYDFPLVVSPDGYIVAGLSEEDCGAVDSFHSSVELWHKRTLLHPFGGSHSTVFTVSNDPRSIDLEWIGPRALAIRYPNDSRNPEEFSCQSQSGDVRIECIGYVPDYGKPVVKMPAPKRWFY
jgi:hypothetical protein